MRSPMQEPKIKKRVKNENFEITFDLTRKK